MFERTIKKFLKEADWLTDEDKPASVGLLAAAKALDDEGVSPALLGQYRLLYNGLMKLKQEKPEAEDDLLTPEDD